MSRRDDNKKTKEKLIDELNTLRQEVGRLQGAQKEHEKELSESQKQSRICLRMRPMPTM